MVELILLAFTATVCAILLLTGVTIAVIAVVNPESDTSTAVNALTHALSVLMGSLLGLLAGRSDTMAALVMRRSKDDP